MPRTHGTQRLLLVSAMMLALLAVCAQVMLPLPLVPVNLALLAVLLIGLLLPGPWALATVAAYLLMGALGLPVFAGLRGGPQALFGVTGGYLLGYLLSAAVLVLLRGRAKGLAGRFFLCLLALLACYVPGTLWLSHLTGRPIMEALPAAVYPFIPGDLLKCLLAALLAGRLRAALQKARLLPSSQAGV